MTFEELQLQYDDLNIVEMDLSEIKGLKGLYYNNNIAIEKTLPESEKACVLAEEIGHHYTTSGNILDQTKIENIKQERKARLWAYNKQIGLTGIIDSFNHGCKNIHEMSEYLCVTETFLKDSLEIYRQKYGESVTVNDYMIQFEPYLIIEKKDTKYGKM